MHVFGWSVLTWSYRALTGAVGHGSRLLARLADGSGGGGRAGRLGVAAPSASASGSQQVSDTPPVAGRSRETAPTQAARRQHRVAARPAATTAVTPAMVRSWAHEQGIQVADRGRIPRSVMQQYLSQVVGTAPVSRRNRALRRPSPAA